jgi:hypothetical protein
MILFSAPDGSGKPFERNYFFIELEKRLKALSCSIKK